MPDQAQMLKEYIDKKRGAEKPGENSKKGPAPRTVCVTSGKGGVGKSNFTVNFALELAKNGKRVLIIDADFGLSNVDVILGISPKFDLSHVIAKKKHLYEIINEGPQGIKFISGGSGVYDLINLDRNDIDYFFTELGYIENFVDVIIFDTGAGINDNNVQIITASDEVVLVTTTEPPAIVDAYALLKTVIETKRRPQLRLVINKAETVKEAKRIIENFVKVTKNYLKTDIEALGYILEDPNVVKSVKSQKPFTLLYPETPASKNMSGIAAKYLTGKTQEDNSGGIRSFFKRFMN
ncbi:MAG: MinD/ParA family protein [Oscillospiraceae bacterium]|nr:MinD/ParA family protein [Oscillospiraceae bacterium]